MDEQTPQEKIEGVLEHIQNVQRNCYKLGLKLIKRGEVELGRNLIANGQIHDNSKFKGIEFDHLFNGDPILSDVIKHHATTNEHHPECWGSIQKMPELYIAEMVCDWAARSSEFGTSLKDWVVQDATVKYNFKMDDSTGKLIEKHLNLLISRSFK